MSEETKNVGTNPTDAANTGNGLDRRDFLNEIAAAALGIAGVGAAVVTVRYVSPNALFEPPTRFHIGVPEDYPVNSVTFLRDQQVFIVRSAQGFIALTAVCTHLGCITEWNPETNLVECPCHGSKFQRDGTKVAGPAPRPLPHLSIQLGPDGELVVDKLNVVSATEILKV
jgi:cytochrome b6-f complex iron-sulfur subunit